MKPTTFFGGAAAALLIFLTLGTLIAVMTRAEGVSALGPADWAAVRFTVTQAVLSAAISVGLAIPVARALARRRFWGRGVLITLLGAPFILPVIVAILGLLAAFGRTGLVSTILGWVGLPPLSIYGFHGVVLAHVFFNLPLATRLILQGWLAIPAERFRLAASLGFSATDMRRRLEWPMLRGVLPGAFMVIFLICLTSFAVALTLGGGPRATTVELAIYQAFRFDFDLGKAALLGIVQLVLTAVAAALSFKFSLPSAMGTGLDRAVERWDAGALPMRLLDSMMLMISTLFLLIPLVLVIARGLPAVLSLPGSVWSAAMNSVLVALASTVLAVGMALSLSLWVVAVRRKAMRGVLEAIGYLAIAASPLVIGTGLFIITFPIADPFKLALPVTALVNAAMAVPFGLRVLIPAAREVEESYGRLAQSLNLTGWSRLRYLTLPRLRRPLGFAGGLAAALSMGDLGVIALFADPEVATLPLQLYRLMAAYRMDAAAGTAVVLLGLSLALFWVFDRGGRVNADA
ncbi:thiamine/thiamine pyrophosphate ABC transporter permease ThiP [Aliiroseovarius sp. YM-037]|uniref:thiamine/thiamine pyrophosphate ABC transporter permease ThiP n=1 Tax=Aliiroseovarius sp. YM-037 TaxID=3341728 RepID=UPI003A8108AF